MDAADHESARPDFALAIYPGHLTRGAGKLNPNVPVTADTPPTFILQAGNDDVDGVQQALVYYTALQAAGVPAELHVWRPRLRPAPHRRADHRVDRPGRYLAAHNRDQRALNPRNLASIQRGDFGPVSVIS